MGILVTGATGYLGSTLVRRLVAAGDGPVHALVRPGSDTRVLDVVRERAPEGALKYVSGTLDSADAAAALLEDVSLVHHLGAAMRGTAEQVFRGTLGTSRHLLDALRTLPSPPRVVLASSLGVYGAAALADGARVDETTPLEARPALRDAYSHAKLEQERMFREAHRRDGIPLSVLRPGVIYGPGRTAPSNRVGFGPRAGFFFLLGHRNRLPLTHVENCAEAFRFAGSHAPFGGEAYDVVDEEVIDCLTYLERYRAEQGGFAILGIPRPALMLASSLNERLHALSRHRVPLLLTRYRSRSTWTPLRYSGEALRTLGFEAPLPGRTGLEAAFAATLRMSG